MDFMKKKLKIVGIGNTILSDNKITFLVMEKLNTIIRNDDIDIGFITSTGMTLLDAIEGFTHLILIDTVKTGKVMVGEVLRYSLSDYDLSPRGKMISGLTLKEIFLLGEKMGLMMPGEVHILGIEIEEDKIISEEVSQKLLAAIDYIADKTLTTIKEMNFKIN